MNGPSLGDLTHEKTPFSFADSIAWCNPSAVRMKRKGASGSPFLTPRSIWNSAVRDPLRRTETEAEDKQPRIHERQTTPKFICSRVLSRKPQLMQSKAFSKSTLKIKAFDLDLRNHDITSLRIRGPSSIERPTMNAGCTLLTTEEITFFIRSARIFDIIL